MKKAPDAFRTISEVADWLDVQAHVLRFWESRFTQVKPVKRAGGRRYYRTADMMLIGGIKTLLHDEGMTIKGVQKVLREKGVEHVSGLSRAIDIEGGQDEDVIDLPATGIIETAPLAAPAATPTEELPMAGDAPIRQDAREGPDEPPNVVTFSNRKPRRPATEQRQNAPVPNEAGTVPTAQPEPETQSAPDTRPEVGPEPEVQSETIAPIKAGAPGQAARDDHIPEASITAVSVTVARETGARETGETPEQAEGAPAEPLLEPEAPVAGASPPEPRIVDASDPPPEAEITVAPGLLGRLARLNSLPAAQLAPLSRLAADIRDRTGQA